MATPERIGNLRLAPSIVDEEAPAEIIQLRPELLSPPTPVERLAFEGLRRAAKLNPRIMPDKEMKRIFPKQH